MQPEVPEDNTVSIYLLLLHDIILLSLVDICYTYAWPIYSIVVYLVYVYNQETCLKSGHNYKHECVSPQQLP